MVHGLSTDVLLIKVSRLFTASVNATMHHSVRVLVLIHVLVFRIKIIENDIDFYVPDVRVYIEDI